MTVPLSCFARPVSTLRQNAARPSPILCPAPAFRWRNQWFLRSGGTAPGQDSFASKAEAEADARRFLAEQAAWLAAYPNDTFDDPPFTHVWISEPYFAIPLPSPA